MNNNNYYDYYKSFKPWLGLIVALIFWSASFIFFIVGMSFDTQLILFGKNIILYVAIALALANTIIQIAGNGSDDMEGIDLVTWLASYALGIGTNVYGLLVVLNMKSSTLEWVVATALGVMIEVSPERQLVKFLKGLKRPSQVQKKKPSRPHNNPYRPNPAPQQPRPSIAPSTLQKRPKVQVPNAHGNRRNEPVYHPVGMSAKSQEEMPPWMREEE